MLMFVFMLCCREFFYIQMEKYSRQALADGVKNVTELVVSADCELYRVLVLHYNRNNQIEVRALAAPRASVALWGLITKKS